MVEKRICKLVDGDILVWPEIERDRETFHAIRDTLIAIGFSWEPDAKAARDYPELADAYSTGRNGGLEVGAELHPILIKLRFYQEASYCSPFGGLHNFNRVQRMPYLIRLRFLKASRRVMDFLKSLGFADRTHRDPKLATAFVIAKRAEFEKTHARYYDYAPKGWCSRDADGADLKDGDVRWFRDRKGRLGRGKVFHNCNGMWWVVVNESRWENLSASSLFSWRPGLPRKRYQELGRKLNSLMLQAAHKKDYEKAIIFRDMLARVQTSREASR